MTHVRLLVLRPVVIWIDVIVPLMDVLRTVAALMTKYWMVIIVLIGLNVDVLWRMDSIFL